MYFLDKKINKIELFNILTTNVDIYSDKFTVTNRKNQKQQFSDVLQSMCS